MPYRTAWVVRVASNLAIDRTRRRSPALPEAGLVPDPADAVTLRLALGAPSAGSPAARVKSSPSGTSAA